MHHAHAAVSEGRLELDGGRRVHGRREQHGTPQRPRRNPPARVDRLERESNPEHGAHPDLTLGLDVPAHHPGQFAGDVEPEARPPEAARRGRVGLGELVEHVPQAVRRNADAGILDRDVVLPADVVHEHLDVPLLGELHRVADEVGEDLLHPTDVAHDVARHRGREPDREVHADRMRPRREHLQDVLDRDEEVEGRVLELQLPGLDLGGVEHVVHDREEHVARPDDDPDLFESLALQSSVRQEIRHPHDPVDRGADLVAHVGEELALRLTRCERGLPRPAEFPGAEVDAGLERPILLLELGGELTRLDHPGALPQKDRQDLLRHVRK